MRTIKYSLTTNKKINKTKIALITDIHYSIKHFNFHKFSQILANLQTNKPDYICLVGDIIDRAEEVKSKKDYNQLLNFLNSLVLISPVIISLGNHDVQKGTNHRWKYYYDTDFFAALNKIPNLYLLDNKLIKIDNIVFYGYTLEYQNYSEINNNILTNNVIKDLNIKKLNFNSNNYNVFLIHNPTMFYKKDIWNALKNIDLVLSGHMHNGLLLPLFDKIISNNGGLIDPHGHFFPKISRGKITKTIEGKEINLIISKGITTIQNCAGIIHVLNFLFPMNIEYISIRGQNEKRK